MLSNFQNGSFASVYYYPCVCTFALRFILDFLFLKFDGSIIIFPSYFSLEYENFFHHTSPIVITYHFFVAICMNNAPLLISWNAPYCSKQFYFYLFPPKLLKTTIYCCQSLFYFFLFFFVFIILLIWLQVKSGPSFYFIYVSTR